jgi:hypothetical protein
LGMTRRVLVAICPRLRSPSTQVTMPDDWLHVPDVTVAETKVTESGRIVF